LKQPARRRGGGGGLRVEVGFHLRGGEQIFEARPGGRRGLPDRARDLRARGIDTCRSRGACCVDRHVSGACSSRNLARALKALAISADTRSRLPQSWLMGG